VRETSVRTTAELKMKQAQKKKDENGIKKVVRREKDMSYSKKTNFRNEARNSLYRNNIINLLLCKNEDEGNNCNYRKFFTKQSESHFQVQIAACKAKRCFYTRSYTNRKRNTQTHRQEDDLVSPLSFFIGFIYKLL
jgi:hypothetical protein